MTRSSYYMPQGGQPSQNQLLSDRAHFTQGYIFMPKGVMRDIVTSNLPHWDRARAWILARPMSGFCDTFAQYIVELEPHGGSDNPEPDKEAQGVLFVTQGQVEMMLEGESYILTEGGYAYIAPGADWKIKNISKQNAGFHWIRKRYENVQGIEKPNSFVTNERDVAPNPMPGTEERWSTTRFVSPEDMRHDMHVNIVNFEPGAVIPFAETHVMEHGLYVLEGKAVYLLNQDWVEVEAGDFMWLRAFCPQACYAGGPGRFRYLLYKDVNRHPKLA